MKDDQKLLIRSFAFSHSLIDQFANFNYQANLTYLDDNILFIIGKCSFYFYGKLI